MVRKGIFRKAVKNQDQNDVSDEQHSDISTSRNEDESNLNLSNDQVESPSIIAPTAGSISPNSWNDWIGSLKSKTIAKLDSFYESFDRGGAKIQLSPLLETKNQELSAVFIPDDFSDASKQHTRTKVIFMYIIFREKAS